MQTAFGLEPLPGEAQVDPSRRNMDAAERQVGGLPDLDAEVVGGEDGAADVAGRDRRRSRRPRPRRPDFAATRWRSQR